MQCGTLVVEEPFSSGGVTVASCPAPAGDYDLLAYTTGSTRASTASVQSVLGQPESVTDHIADYATDGTVLTGVAGLATLGAANIYTRG